MLHSKDEGSFWNKLQTSLAVIYSGILRTSFSCCVGGSKGAKVISWGLESVWWWLRLPLLWFCGTGRWAWYLSSTHTVFEGTWARSACLHKQGDMSMGNEGQKWFLMNGRALTGTSAGCSFSSIAVEGLFLLHCTLPSSHCAAPAPLHGSSCPLVPCRQAGHSCSSGTALAAGSSPVGAADVLISSRDASQMQEPNPPTRNGKSRVKHCLLLHVIKSLALLFLRNVSWDWHKTFSIRFWTSITCRSYSSPFTFHPSLPVLTDCHGKDRHLLQSSVPWWWFCADPPPPISASPHDPLDSATQLCVIPESLCPTLSFF